MRDSVPGDGAVVPLSRQDRCSRRLRVVKSQFSSKEQQTPCPLRTSDDNVLYPSSNPRIAILVDSGLVSCVHPQDAVLVANHDLCRLVRGPEVAFLQEIAGRAYLAAHAHGYNVPLLINDLGSRVRHDPADSFQLVLWAIAYLCQEAARRSFRHT